MYFLKFTDWNNNHSETSYSGTMSLEDAKKEAQENNSLVVEEISPNSYWSNGREVEIREAESGKTIHSLPAVKRIEWDYVLERPVEK